MDMNAAIELNKWRQSIEPTIKIFRDQLRDQLVPIDSKLEHLKTQVAYLEKAVDKNTRKSGYEANKFDMPEGECLTLLKNGVVMPKFIEVQNLAGDYYINVDHIVRIENEANAGEFRVCVTLAAPNIVAICTYWKTEKEANKEYKRIKKALM